MLAVLACSATFAQFQRAPQCREALAAKGTNTLPTWGQIAAPFTATDINGNPVSLQSYLDAGISVVVDYSCCWCGPCWSLHTTGILEALDAEDSIQVIWVEIEDGNTTAQIYGTNGSGSSATTQGNWTLDSHGNPVTYPIIDNSDCLNTCASLYEGYVPSVYLITPSGYFCSLYGEDWGFGTSTAPAQAVSIVNGLIGQAPRAGQAPVVNINGLTTAVVGSPVSFTAEVISVDPIVSYSWTFADGTPATATTANASTTWATTGIHQVTLEVTNTTGTTTATLDVNVIDWTWGDEMSYTLGGSYVSSVGTGSGITWGAKYPAAFMAGRNYLENVKVYANEAAHYTLDIYQANGAAPTANDMLYEYTYAVSAGDNTLPIYDQLQLDAAKDLWVVFTCSDASYPAAGTDFSGDPNGSLVCFNGEWSPVYDLNPELMYTWMISATTSATAPAMVVELNGPANASTNTAVTFTAVGPSAASYSWTFANGTPATATGSTVSTTWTTAGTYAVTLTATLNGETATKTMNVNVVSCDPRNLPFTCGFEANDDFGCWNFVDADGDGYNWDLEFGPSIGKTHSGSGSVGTASFRNDVGVLSPDNWMITPAIVVPAEGATIEWWVAGVDQNYYAEYYSVLVSTTGNNPADFTNTVFAGTVSNFDWTKVSRSLAGFAGQTIYVAFRHHNISDMYWMLLDDISITAGNHAGIAEVNDINVSLYPNPTTGKLNVNAEGAQEINVLDINGRVVMTANNTNTIDLSNLSNGCYFVRVITNAGVSTQKIVKE